MEKDKFIAKAAKALGDRHRLILLREIASRGSINATQAQQILNQSQPSVSYHIKQLIDCEFIESNKVGRMIYLAINRNKVQEFSQFFGDILIFISPLLVGTADPVL